MLLLVDGSTTGVHHRNLVDLAGRLDRDAHVLDLCVLAASVAAAADLTGRVAAVDVTDVATATATGTGTGTGAGAAAGGRIGRSAPTGPRGRRGPAGEPRAIGRGPRTCPPGPAFPLAFARLLRRTRPDVVHVAAQVPAGLTVGAALLLARITGVPRRVAHLHGVDPPRPAARDAGQTHPADDADRSGHRGRAGRARRAAGRLLLDACATDLLVTSAAAVGVGHRADRAPVSVPVPVPVQVPSGRPPRIVAAPTHVPRRGGPRVQVVHPGVELESFGVAIAARGRPGTGGPGATVLHIADRAPRGERARAVDLVGTLHGLGVRARLRVVGRLDAGEAADLTARAAGAGVADALELAGERSDVPRLLVDAALLVVTSAGEGEGLPGAVLAAAAVGTPVLATESPELTELAALLPGITTLPRVASAAVWASAAADLLAVPPTPDDRWEALRRLRRSSFTRDRWEHAVTAAWS